MMPDGDEHVKINAQGNACKHCVLAMTTKKILKINGRKRVFGEH